MAQMVKNPSQCRRPEFSPWAGRSAGDGNGNPFQYSCLQNPVDRGGCGLHPWDCKELNTTEWLIHTHTHTHRVQFSSVAQSCLTLCNPMDCSTPGFPVHPQLQELAQTHVHRVSDAIQPSHPLSPSSPPALNLSQHQGLFQWVGSSPQVAKVLEFQLQHQSFQWIFSRHNMGLCVCMCSVAQLCPVLCNPMDYSPPDSSVHGIILARILVCVAISSFKGSSRPRD